MANFTTVSMDSEVAANIPFNILFQNDAVYVYIVYVPVTDDTANVVYVVGFVDGREAVKFASEAEALQFCC